MVVALSMSACGLSPSRESVVAASARRDDQLRARAAFDLQCSKEEIQVTPLDQTPNYFHRDVVDTQVAGVKGCGKQTTYIFHRGVWILNADSQPAK